MPTPTDLVTDLPADFEVFGQAVDTSMADLKGGTTGQILSKNSNTDMDFVWIANDQGDITGVTATSPLTGGGTSGEITVGIQAASTSQSGAVQLTDSTSSTSITTAATPNSVKSTYDLANAAIPKSTATAKGNVFTATASSTPAVLAVGTNGQILTADSTAATGLKWTTISTSPTAVGVSLTAASQSVPNASTLTVAWNQEFFDTDGFHDNATNNSRITIPSGKAGKYLIGCDIMWQDANANTRIVQLWKNGVNTGTRFAFGCASIGNTYYYSMSLVSAQTLAVGDYIEVQVQNNDSSAKYIYGTGSPGLGEGALTFYATYLGA